MNGSSFMIGIVIGIAILVVPSLAVGASPTDTPGAVLNWLVELRDPGPDAAPTAVPVGLSRPRMGFEPGDPVPTPMPLPNPAGNLAPPAPSAPPPVIAAAPGAPAAQAPHCPPGVQPQFVLGFATLKQQLGPTMGEPVECEHRNPRNGDTVQRTTTGLAYYHPSSGLIAFTDGWRHYAPTTAGMLTWEGESATPPAEAIARLRARTHPAGQPPAVPGQPAPNGDGQTTEASVPAADGERLQVVNTDGDGVVFRNSPRMDDRRPSGLLEGARVTLLERSGPDWVRVRADDGREGWVPAQYVAPVR